MVRPRAAKGGSTAMNKVLVIVLSVFFLSLLPAAASADDAGANVGANVTTDTSLCGDSGECKSALAQCRQDLEQSSTSAAVALENFNKCKTELGKVTKQSKPKAAAPPPAPPAPQCSGSYTRLEGGKCLCTVDAEGKGAENLMLMSVLKHGSNLFVCVSSAEVARMLTALKNQVDALCASDDECKDMRDYVDGMTKLFGQPKAFYENWKGLNEWVKTQLKHNADVDHALADLGKGLGVVCPEIPDNPNASMYDRCRYWANQGHGSKVKVNLSAKGIAGHRPGAGGYQGAVGHIEVEIAVPRTNAAVIGAVYSGVVADADTGTQAIGGLEAGARFYVNKSRRTAVDVKGYYQQYWSTHSAGYQGVLQDKGMGGEGGGRVGFRHCFTPGDSFCVGAEGGVGYSPNTNYFVGPYNLGRDRGVTYNGGLGVSGDIDLY